MARHSQPPPPPPAEFDEPYDDQDWVAQALSGRDDLDFNAWVNRQIRTTPWWAVSLALHLLILAIAMAFKGSPALQAEEQPIFVNIKPPQVEKINIERPKDIIQNDKLLKDPNVVEDPVVKNAEVAEHNETADNEEFNQAKGESEDFISDKPLKGQGVYDAIGVGGGGGGKFGGRLGGKRNRVARGGGGDRTEGAVLAGLRWLARHQGDDGSWDAVNYSAQCKKTICEGKGYAEYNAGLTGLCLLAFLGAGYTHQSKETYSDPVTGKEMNFGRTVKEGLRWLIKNQDAEGCFGSRSVAKMMYNHTVGALAMAEAYGLTSSPLFKEPAQKGIDFLIAAKNPYKAWRYSPKCGDNDSSVTGWAVMALKSAEISGLSISRSAMEESKAFIDEITDKNYGKCGYRTAEDAGKRVIVEGKNDTYANHEALTAVGMVVRAFVDHDIQDPMLKLGARVLVGDLPVWDKVKKTNDYYYWYYGTLALFQYDGPDSGNKGDLWKLWNKAMVEAVVKNQDDSSAGCGHGSWSSDDRWGFEGGRVCSTALLTLTLEVYYRFDNAFGIGKRK